MSTVKGIELCRQFYLQHVRRIIDAHFPGLQHSAALLGPGSEVLGFDDATSTDHHFGPRVILFLSPEDLAQYKDKLDDALRWNLPHEFMGFPTNFTEPNPDDSGNQMLQKTESGPINHRVEIWTINEYIKSYLELDMDNQQMETADWLSLPQQKLLTFSGGTVYHDDDQLNLSAIQSKFSYFPNDIWLFLMASIWSNIGQEEHLMGRAGMAGDNLGSRLIAARLVTLSMKLLFLIEKKYWPYAKWFGTAFEKLKSGPALKTLLEKVLEARDWNQRGEWLAKSYECLARKHNELGVTSKMPETAEMFWGRPLKVIWGDRFAEAIIGKIGDPGLVKMARRACVGSIDIFSDSTEVLERLPRKVARKWFEESSWN